MSPHQSSLATNENKKKKRIFIYTLSTIAIIAEAVVIIILLFFCKPNTAPGSTIPINTVINAQDRYVWHDSATQTHADWISAIDEKNGIPSEPTWVNSLVFSNENTNSITVSSTLPQYSGFVTLHYDYIPYVHLDDWSLNCNLIDMTEAPTSADIQLWVRNYNDSTHSSDEWDGFMRNTVVSGFFQYENKAQLSFKNVQTGYPKFLGSILVSWTIA